MSKSRVGLLRTRLPEAVIEQGRAAVRAGSLSALVNWHIRYVHMTPELVQKTYGTLFACGEFARAEELFEKTAAQFNPLAWWCTLVWRIAKLLVLGAGAAGGLLYLARTCSRMFSLAPVIMAALVATFEPADDPEEWRRFANVAVAADRAVTEQVERGWVGSRSELIAATITAIRFEAGPRMSRAVHAGENTKNGWCLGQIHDSNGFWKDYVEHPRELTGTGVDATYRCLRTVTRTLAFARAYCLRKPHYYVKKWRTAMWSLYGTGHKCWISPTAARRAKFQAALEARRFVPDAHMIELVEQAARGTT